MKFKRIWLLCLALTTSTTAFAAPPMPELPLEDAVGGVVEQVPQPGSDISEISVQRRPCRGSCPEDEIILRADGTAQYEGRRHVERIGIYTGRLREGDWRKLAALFDAQFFDLKDRYAIPATDLPSTVTTATRGDKKKSVEDYGNIAPPQLWGLEMAVRGLASQIAWKKIEMKGASGVWGNAVLSVIGGVAPAEGIQVKPSFSPMRNTAIVVETAEGKEVARTLTDKDGDFQIALPAGDYLLIPDPKKADGTMEPMIRSHQPIQVKANGWTQTKVSATLAMP